MKWRLLENAIICKEEMLDFGCFYRESFQIVVSLEIRADKASAHKRNRYGRQGVSLPETSRGLHKAFLLPIHHERESDGGNKYIS